MCPIRYDPIKISTQDEANTHISFIMHYIHRTPSMTSKLPKMVLYRVDALMDYWRKRDKSS